MSDGRATRPPCAVAVCGVILAHHHERTLHASGARRTDHDGPERPARRPRQPHPPLHRGRRHRARHLARVASASSTRRSRRRTAASARSPGSRSTPARRRSSSYNNWLPDETVDAFRKYLVGIKGPLTTPIGGGIRSLNVALRQLLDLYVCLRPGALVQGRAQPGQAPAGRRHGDLPREHRGHLRRHRVRGGDRRREEGARLHREGVPEGVPARSASRRRPAIGIKPVSREGTERLVRAAIEYALDAEAKERHASSTRATS